MYTFTSADAWKTYDIFVTATDSTNLTDQYELVLTTNTFQHGQSMAAGSPWYGMNESTSTDPQTCGVQFPQWPSPNSAPFQNVQVVITQLPADGTLFIGGARGSRGACTMHRRSPSPTRLTTSPIRISAAWTRFAIISTTAA